MLPALFQGTKQDHIPNPALRNQFNLSDHTPNQAKDKGQRP